MQIKKEIAASILGVHNKKELINKLIDNGIKYIHYDVMDGDFVKNKSLPLEELKYLFNSTKKHYKDIHLMVNYPEKYIKQLINQVDQISIHVESLKEKNLNNLILKFYNKTKLGLVVNPDTNFDDVFPYLSKLNHVMIMSVIPGKGGQTFIESSLEKIDLLKEEIKKQNTKIIIEIDGGINEKWGPIVFKRGVNLSVSGSYLINNLENGSIKKLLK